MQSNEMLFNQITQRMDTKKVRGKLESWLKQAKQTKDFIKKHKASFNEWRPLKFYVALGNSNTFSIRYKGQEVAILDCSKDCKPIVRMGERLLKRNKQYFKYSPQCCDFEWSGVEGARFRKHFNKEDYKVHSLEHYIESELIAGLISKKKSEESPLRNRIAVSFENFPLQFPVPFAASKGAIGKNVGHLDILGRKHPGVLSIWELKSSKCYKGAALQAYIYALQVYCIINDPYIGKDWLELFGFSRKSKTPKVEIIIGVSEKHTEQVKKEIMCLKEEMKKDGIEGLFSWHIACYKNDSPNFTAHELSMQQII